MSEQNEPAVVVLHLDDRTIPDLPSPSQPDGKTASSDKQLAYHGVLPVTAKASAPPEHAKPTVHLTNAAAGSAPHAWGAVGLWDYILCSWINPLLRLGSQRILQNEDLFALAPEEQSRRAYADFLPAWHAEQKLAAEQSRKPRLMNAMKKLHAKLFVLSGFLFAISAATQLLAPEFLKHIVSAVTEKAQAGFVINGNVRTAPEEWEAYMWTCILLGSNVIGAVLRAVSMYQVTQLLIRARAAAIAVIFDKSLRAGFHQKRDGAVVNLMSSDSQRITELAFGAHMVWSGLPIVIAGVWLMYEEVQEAAIAGFATMFLFFPLAGRLVKRQFIAQRLASLETDKRVNIINEFIQGIRVVKFYAWEKPFLKKVDEVREQELKHLRTFVIARAVNFGMMMFTPLLASIVTFIVFSAKGGEMTAARVFTTISLIYVIRFPFSFLPMAIQQWVQIYVAFGRIEDYLATPEVQPYREELSRPGVEIVGADFRWAQSLAEKKDEGKEGKADGKQNGQTNGHGKAAAAPKAKDKGKKGKKGEEAEKKTEGVEMVEVKAAPQHPRLANINFTAEAGQLVSVIGPVASGKTTLLSGMLGELMKDKGHVRIGGKVAYVPQTAFVINASLKDNILFNRPFDAQRYEACIRACALQADIDQLPNGDNTEIGERGINISGGQKQRVSMARAAYNTDVDVILLDDPLSAVDAHVAKHIFDNCINGLMRGKCRVLVTHTLQFLPQSDKVVVLTETENKDSYTCGLVGTYDQLLRDSSEFQRLIETFNKGKEDMKKQDKAGAKETKGAEKQEDKVKGSLVEREEREEGEVTWDIYKRYFLAGGTVAFFVWLFLWFCATQGASTGGDFWLSHWTNDVIAASKTGATLDDHGFGSQAVFYLFVYGCFVVAFNIFSIVRAIAVAVFGVKASRDLHDKLVRNVLAKSMAFFDRTPTGRILNRFTKDMYSIDFLMSQQIEMSLSTSLAVVGILVVIAVIVPLSLTIFLILSVVYYRIQLWYRKSSRELQRLESIARTPIFTHFSEALGGVVTIRALGMQKHYSDSNLDRIDLNHQCFFQMQVSGFCWLRVRLDIIGAFVTFGATVLALLGDRYNFAVDAGGFGLLVTYALNMSNVLNWACIMVTQLEQAMNCIERVQYYSVPRDLEKWEAEDQKLSESVQTGWPSEGQIELRGLSMRYRENLDLVLNKIDCVVPAGKRVGIVGRTGSGKSSMLLALFRLVEAAEGKILIDDVDISKISLTDLRSKIAIIPQDPVLYYGTLQYNLDPFGVHTDAEIWQALEYVQLKGVVDRMEKKLSSVIEEGGKNLSLGQRQLLCLARALLRNPKIICLDEATASVDIQTDDIIQRVVRDKFAGCTVLTIAHRLNTIMDYDLVMVLDKGRLVEFDHPYTLKAKENGVFASMLATHSQSRTDH